VTPSSLQVLEELEKPSSPYDHVVLQASENSVGFYEHHGFVRVGAIARYVRALESVHFD
jgi:predicted GNAT family N-acyltransferase